MTNPNPQTVFREQRPKWTLLGGRVDARLFGVLRVLCGVPATPIGTPSDAADAGLDEGGLR